MRIIPTQTYFNLNEAKQSRILDAAINEFTKRNLENAKLSNIIKESKIPRGSFYQYFEDKDDLYRYIFEKIKEKKLEYLSESLSNPRDLSFTVLFKEIYSTGVLFALDNPKYVQIFSLMDPQSESYKLLMGDGLELAKEYYMNFIKRDQSLGRIREDVDAEILAQLVVDMTTNVSITGFIKEDNRFDMESMVKKIDQIMNIFEKGITGE